MQLNVAAPEKNLWINWRLPPVKYLAADVTAYCLMMTGPLGRSLTHVRLFGLVCFSAVHCVFEHTVWSCLLYSEYNCESEGVSAGFHDPRSMIRPHTELTYNRPQSHDIAALNLKWHSQVNYGPVLMCADVIFLIINHKFASLSLQFSYFINFLIYLSYSRLIICNFVVIFQ